MKFCKYRLFGAFCHFFLCLLLQRQQQRSRKQLTLRSFHGWAAQMCHLSGVPGT